MDTISPHMLGANVQLFTGPAASEAPGSGRIPPVRRLLQLASRWRWVLLGGIALGALAGILMTLTATRQYTSTVRLEITRDTARVVNIDSVQRDTSVGDQEFYQTQYGLLQTKILAERVARDLGVVDDPAFFRLFGRDTLPGSEIGDPKSPAARAKRLEIAGKILLAHVGVAPVRGSRLVDVSAVTPDPALSQRIVQCWSKNFIDSNLERRFDASSYARR